MTNFFFRRGDLVRHSRVDYFATNEGGVDTNIEEEIALFIGFIDSRNMDICKIYAFSDSKIITVAAHNLTLLSKNEK